MATYTPPTEDFSYPDSFNPIVFRSADDSITIAEGDTRYLRFPVSQGSETISGNLTITGEGFCSTVPTGNTSLANKLYVDNAVVGGSILGTNNTWTGTNAFNTSLPTSTQTPTTSTELTTKTYVDSAISGASILGTNNTWTGTNAFNTSLPTSTQTPTTSTELTTKTYVDTASVSLLGSNNTWTGTNAFGTMSAGATTLTSVATNTITGATIQVSPSVGINVADQLTTGTINIGRQDTTSTSTLVNIASGNGQTGTISLGAGTGTKIMNIGGTSTTLGLVGSAITASLMSIAGALSAGASTLTSVITNTITSSAPTGFNNLYNNITSGNVNIATSATSGTVFIGNGTPATVNTQGVQILSGALGTGELWLGYGGARTIRMGSTNSTIEVGDTTTSTISLRGSTINATRMAITNALSAGASTLASASITGLMSSATATVSGALSAGASTLTSVITNTITGTAVGTPVSLYSESSRSGAIEIGNGGTRSGDIRIGNGVSTTGAVLIGRNGGGVSIGASGSTNTIDGTTNIANGTHSILGNTTINSGGTASTQLGNNSASAVVNILGAVSLNTTGSTQNTSIGNTTGTLSLIGDVNYADGDFSFATTTTNNLTPTSTVLMLLTSTVPTGWLYCDGSAVSRSTYSRLFAVISTTFGAGNGTTTFNIPNFKGAFLRGNDTQTVGGIAYTAAAVGTAQQDSVLEAYNEGFWNVDSGGGGSSRAVRARVQITGDPEDTGANSTTKFVRQNATENRVFNFAVYYYIKF